MSNPMERHQLLWVGIWRFQTFRLQFEIEKSDLYSVVEEIETSGILLPCRSLLSTVMPSEERFPAEATGTRKLPPPSFPSGTSAEPAVTLMQSKQTSAPPSSSRGPTSSWYKHDYQAKWWASRKSAGQLDFLYGVCQITFIAISVLFPDVYIVQPFRLPRQVTEGIVFPIFVSRSISRLQYHKLFTSRYAWSWHLDLSQWSHPRVEVMLWRNHA